jgi:hypothetical protein
MDYGRLFTRAWEIIWGHKFLIVLGMLVVLGSAGGAGGTRTSFTNLGGQRPETGAAPFNFQAPFENFSLGGLEVAAVILIAIVILAVLVALWILSLIARGGLIHGANRVDVTGSSSFSESFSAAGGKGGRLIAIGLLPAIPVALLVIGGLISFFATSQVVVGEGPALGMPRSLTWIPFLGVACILTLASLMLALLRTFANRACMLEDRGVIDSYRRGFEVLAENFGAALVLFVLQLVLGLVIGLVLLVPGIVVSLCCLLWPLLLLVQGTFSAYYSTLWTLAWSQWTGEPRMIEVQAG